MPHYVLDARTATPHFPGIGRYVRNLAQALAPQLGPQEKLTLVCAPGHPIEIPHRVVEMKTVPTSPFSLRQQWTLPRLLKHLDADVYHSAYYLMPYAPGVPTLLTVYDLIPMLFPEQSSLRAQLLFRWMTRFALYTAKHVITISQATQQDLLKYFSIPPEKTTITPLAADPQFEPQTEKAIHHVRQRYQLPAKFLLYLGSNKPHKNLVTLVHAYAQLQEMNPPPLVIAGAWIPDYPQARQHADKLGLDETQVYWLGRIAAEDLPALYAAATLFVFPSLYEGFGLPVIEAMACGTPVACSNVSSLPEVVGEAAHLFNPYEASSITASIKKLLHQEISRENLEHISLAQAASFSWQRTATQTLVVYRYMLSA